jgi:hypothetical protein
MKRYEIKKCKPQLTIGQKFGALTVCSDPYYIVPPGSGHRRQYFDFKCDCGKIKECVKGACLKRGTGILTYCSRDCELYINALPKDVPEDSKLCKVGEKYNHLTVTKDAFYHKEKGSPNRHKYVEVQCKCGKFKKYRESKVFNGSYKSCGCVWEHKDKKERSWNFYEKLYGISKQDYYNILEKQNNKCCICGSGDSNTRMTSFLFIDHCHESGKVRGLLCNSCNTGLGCFKDSIENLKNAIKYLENQ